MSSIAALPFSAWPTGRKLAAGLFADPRLRGAGCTAVYLSGVLFLVLNKANLKQAQLDEHRPLLGLLRRRCPTAQEAPLAIGVSGLGLLILLPAGYSAARPRRALHGDARFASPAEVDPRGPDRRRVGSRASPSAAIAAGSSPLPGQPR